MSGSNRLICRYVWDVSEISILISGSIPYEGFFEYIYVISKHPPPPLLVALRMQYNYKNPKCTIEYVKQLLLIIISWFEVNKTEWHWNIQFVERKHCFRVKQVSKDTLKSNSVFKQFAITCTIWQEFICCCLSWYMFCLFFSSGVLSGSSHVIFTTTLFLTSNAFFFTKCCWIDFKVMLYWLVLFVCVWGVLLRLVYLIKLCCSYEPGLLDHFYFWIFQAN